MKKITPVLFATFLALGLMSCNDNKEECSHVDSDKNHTCDLCETPMGEHKDFDGDDKCDYCGEVFPNVKSLSITNAPSQMMVDDQITLLTDVATIGGASDKVIWSIDKTDVASINENGLLTALSTGDVVVTAKAEDNNEIIDSTTITVVAKEWSENAKQMMFSSFSMVLPYSEKGWSEPELIYDNIVASSKEGNLTNLKATFAEAGYQIQDAAFPYGDSSEEAPGFTAKKDICTEGYLTVEIGDFSSNNEGFKLKAYAIYTSWPASLVEQYLSGVEGSVPALEADSYKVEFFTSTIHIYCYKGNLENYFSILSSSYYIEKTMSDSFGPYVDYSTYFAENFTHTIQMALFEYNSYILVNPFATTPISPRDNWNEREISIMQEVLGETLPFVNAEFVFSKGELNRIPSLESYSLRIGSFEMAAKVFSDDDSWAENYDSDSLLYTFTKTSSLDEEKIVIVTILHEFGQCYLNAYCVNPEQTNWPAQAISDYISGYTAETVPSWDGILFIASYYVQTYEAMIIDAVGDANDYLAILQEAHWGIFDSEYGYSECISPNGTITVVVLPQHGKFQIQIIINK